MSSVLNLTVDDELCKLVQKWEPHLDIVEAVKSRLYHMFYGKDSYLDRLKEFSNMEQTIERLRQDGNRDLIPPNFQGFFCSQFQGKLPATILISSI